MAQFKCPLCGCTFCRHWIGWTEDGRTIELKAGGTAPLLPADRVIKTGVSARVYRDDPPALPVVSTGHGIYGASPPPG
jgi:hypothetical protein